MARSDGLQIGAAAHVGSSHLVVEYGVEEEVEDLLMHSFVLGYHSAFWLGASSS